MNYKHFLKILLTIAITAGLIFWIVHQIQGDVLLKALEDANYSWLFLGCLCTFSIILLNSIQFKLFLPKPGMVKFSKMVQLISIFSMAVNVLPFWGGHALMIYLLGQKEKIKKTVALSVVTLDQIIEGFAKIFLFGAVAFSAYFPPWMKTGMKSFLALILVTYSVFFFLAYKYRDHADELHDLSGPLWSRVSRIFKKWAHHLHVLRNWRPLVLTVALATFMKFLEVLAVFFIQIALGVELGFMAAVVAVAAISLATTLPLTPGRLGIFEAGAMVTYQFLGLDPTQGLALGVMIHVVHTVPFILAGYLSSLNMGFKGFIPKVEMADPAYEGT